jgi:ribonucleotide monophosphatase NagD (HAD superfamily)
MIAALVASTDQNPEIIVGKPAIFGFEYLLDQMDCKSTDAIMIGDRYETDIMGAVDAGIFSIVVNTGVAASRKRPNSWHNYPDVPLIQSLTDLIA